jgi:beta-aspartyl-peptidase (threonine type)
MNDKRVILVHGGAWAVPDGEKEPHLDGVRRAVSAGWHVLSGGGSALDAVVEAVRLMESNPALNAGRGSVLNRNGEVEVDAGIMDGDTLAAGAVASVQGVENPIELARKVMESTPHVLLVGTGAASFARQQGIATCDPSDLVVPRERSRWEAAKIGADLQNPGDTVGAVACDEKGCVAAGTSTGGSLMKLPGRVGDSPVVGAGLYADNQLGAASSTGWGEGSIRVVLAHRAVSLISTTGSASEAAREAIWVLESRTGGAGGVIVVDKNGTPGFHFNTPCMAHAYMKEELAEPFVAI